MQIWPVIEGSSTNLSLNSITRRVMVDNTVFKRLWFLSSYSKTINSIYQWKVTTNSNIYKYIESAWSQLTKRISNHYSTFRHANEGNKTGLSKRIWVLKDHKKQFNLEWNILSFLSPYDKDPLPCSLCNTELFMILLSNFLLVNTFIEQAYVVNTGRNTLSASKRDFPYF